MMIFHSYLNVYQRVDVFNSWGLKLKQQKLGACYRILNFPSCSMSWQPTQLSHRGKCWKIRHTWSTQVQLLLSVVLHIDVYLISICLCFYIYIYIDEFPWHSLKCSSHLTESSMRKEHTLSHGHFDTDSPLSSP